MAVAFQIVNSGPQSVEPISKVPAVAAEMKEAVGEVQVAIVAAAITETKIRLPVAVPAEHLAASQYEFVSHTSEEE